MLHTLCSPHRRGWRACCWFGLVLSTAIVHGAFVAEGVRLVPLTDDGRSLAVSWAWHGDEVATLYTISGLQRQLVIMKADGSDARKVSPIGFPYFAEWSWKGDQLTYLFANASDAESQCQVFVYDLATDRSTALSAPYTRESMDPDDGPIWSADDRHIAYKVRVGPSRSRQMWIAEVQTGKTWRLLPQRQCKDQRWSPTDPRKLALLIDSAGGGFDVATVNLDGSELTPLTNIGAAEVYTDRPRWSPDGRWIAFKSDQDMTKTEHEMRVEDCWIGRPDGSDVRNLTRASSPATEHMLNLFKLQWTWDGRWIISQGQKYDNQGHSVQVLYRIDPKTGEYTVLRTSRPRETGEIEFYRAHEISYDGSKLAYLVTRATVRNWGSEPQYENFRSVLGIYDLRTGDDAEILVFDRQLDRKRILADQDRWPVEDISWSPDSGSILLTIAKIISEEDDILQPDVYRLDLPDRFVSPQAAAIDGPPTGRRQGTVVQSQVATTDQAASAPTPTPAEESTPTPTAQADTTPAGSRIVTEVVRPQHITIAEAIESLPTDYQQYFTTNASRNMLLFKGPADVLAELKDDLALVDTEPPHILVDLLAVELSDAANRSLGLDWTYAEGHFALFEPSGSAIRDLTPDTRLDGITTFPGIGQAFYQGVGRLPREFFIRLNTLVQDGQGTILANPRTVATSGKQSLIQIRKTQNFFFNEGFDTAGRPIVKKSDISSDTQGQITPTLLPDGRIHLVVDVSVGTFTFTTQANLPEQTTRKATTEVTVREGETIVIGGLRQQEMSHSETKIPLLADLPLLGGLFKSESDEVRHSVLTIFITPQVMNGHDLQPDWPTLDPDDHPMVPIMETDLER